VQLKAEATMPEIPGARRCALHRVYALREYGRPRLNRREPWRDFEESSRCFLHATEKFAAHWVMGIWRYAAAAGVVKSRSLRQPRGIGRTVALDSKGRSTGKLAKGRSREYVRLG